MYKKKLTDLKHTAGSQASDQKKKKKKDKVSFCTAVRPMLISHAGINSLQKFTFFAPTVL